MNVEIPCVCGRHERDSVTLRDVLDFRAAITARHAITLFKAEDPDASAAEVLALLTETYLLVGVESWTLEDAKGKPIPVTRETIRERLLTHPDAAMAVGDEADGLYTEAVLLPLLARASTSSPPGPTNGPTSATTTGRASRPKRSSPSSITRIPTADTATITPPLAGASSS